MAAELLFLKLMIIFSIFLKKIGFYVMLGVALLYMLLVIKLFNKINLGIGLLKIASATTYSL